ncbi:sugar phosphate isomerase/epimerase family protein [Desulfosarcina ovata]|uniref:Xylose isomerase n=1 Tax=Desulfosarcina ovata subsp. ovata TaxID=2752305 RepID=A0A5K8A5X6_9BACT|nr:sugar phosphate isomerase/epimerase family protein [Desulfosarcina ovata]BBO87580.1 xylose isomerase [Desulfosarcina ovata subsp. ovata]
MFRLGYNTNGFAHHRLADAIAIIGQLEYDCVAITLDHGALDPWDPSLDQQLRDVKRQLDHLGLSCVIETGARFLLNPWEKHEPTLLSDGDGKRFQRMEFLKRVVDIAVELDAAAVSFWSGAKPENVEKDLAWKWLVDGCRQLSNYASDKGMPLGFEPEPGMFIETLTDFKRLKTRVGNSVFQLTLDVGHALITEPISVAECIRQYRADIINIHLEDMKKDRHNHLFFGDGEVDFLSVFQALQEINYSGPVCVELSRHSHQAVETARSAKTFLSEYLQFSISDSDTSSPRCRLGA